jgi:uncharacterized protein with PhoU and TrkA domain
MAARVTIERILRDDDDMQGQSVRDWKIEAERGHVVIRLKHGDGFIMLRPADIEIFTDDLARAKAAALDLT